MPRLVQVDSATVVNPGRFTDQRPARFAQEGHVAPAPTHSHDRLPAIEAQADLILSTYETRPEFFLRELRDALAAQGVQTSTSGLSRFFARHGITRKRGRCTRLSRSGRT